MVNDVDIVNEFNFEGCHYKIKLYEIKNSMSDTVCELRVFSDDNNPANGYSYRVAFDGQVNMNVLKENDLIKELAENAKNDVLTKRYERLIEAIKEIKH